MNDYRNREYLSSLEVAKYLGITVGYLHELVRDKKIISIEAATSQKRFKLEDIKNYKRKHAILSKNPPKTNKVDSKNLIINDTSHTVHNKNAMAMGELADDSIHLMVTSPPYFNAKMYSNWYKKEFYNSCD